MHAALSVAGLGGHGKVLDDGRPSLDVQLDRLTQTAHELQQLPVYQLVDLSHLAATILSSHPTLPLQDPLPCPILYHTPACSALTWQAKHACWRNLTQPRLSYLIAGTVKWSGKMTYVTLSHDITTQRYRCANSVLRYRRSKKSVTIL